MGKEFNQWMASLTWTCMICGKERPDNKISVDSRDASKTLKVPGAIQNIRYCNDSEYCTKEAKVRSLRECKYR